MTPLVSIITPAYNCMNFLPDTIRSIQNQTYNNWEHIIVDDASSDNTKIIIQEYAKKDSRIRYIFMSKNLGVAVARNTGIMESKGKYIAFLDSDDLWKPEKLSVHINYMEKNNVQFTYSNYDIMNENGLYIKEIIAKERIDYRNLLYYNIIGCLTVVIDSNVMKKNKMPLIKHEDYAAWLNILRCDLPYAYNVGETLASYRKLSTSVSSNKYKTLKWTWNIYRNNQDMSLLNSLIHMLTFILFTSLKYIRK